MHQVSLVVDRVGTGVLGLFEFVGAIAAFGGRAVVEAVRPPYEPREILRHLFQFGSRSAPLILAAGFAIGIVLSMHTRAYARALRRGVDDPRRPGHRVHP